MDEGETETTADGDGCWTAESFGLSRAEDAEEMTEDGDSCWTAVSFGLFRTEVAAEMTEDGDGCWTAVLSTRGRHPEEFVLVTWSPLTCLWNHQNTKTFTHRVTNWHTIKLRRNLESLRSLIKMLLYINSHTFGVDVYGGTQLWYQDIKISHFKRIIEKKRWYFMTGYLDGILTICYCNSIR